MYSPERNSMGSVNKLKVKTITKLILYLFEMPTSYLEVGLAIVN